MSYSPPLISGPIAPENNPPINPQYYQPSVFNISTIGLNTPAIGSTTVTTTVNHNYVVGQLVRLVISQLYGSFQLNEQEGLVTSIPAANQVVLNINSSRASPFISNPSSGTTQPQIVAVGDTNSGTINASGRSSTGTYIPGSFIDISPL